MESGQARGNSIVTKTMKYTVEHIRDTIKTQLTLKNTIDKITKTIENNRKQ